jgi:plasmid stability protein
MSRVIHIRDVPDDVHEALTAAASARGQSLSAYMRTEIEQLARRARSVEHNAEVVRRAKAEIAADVPREAILAAIRESRGE